MLMKVIQINATCGSGSTGKICCSISEILSEKGIENYIFYTDGQSDYPLGKKYASYWYKKIQALKSRILGNNGFNSHYATWKLIRSLDAIKPDLVHIHNIHGHDCNLTMLLRYLKKKHIRILWTFHDCWVFTGSCPHYTMAGCEQWKCDCSPCPQIRQTSWFFDRSKVLLQKKKNLLQGQDLTIVTPSQWLSDQVKLSFLKNYPVKVIYNGIDLGIFKPTESDFRQKYHCEDKKIVLGVAMGWGVRKGLDVFADLASRLPNDYQIVLVGGNEQIDRQLPSNVISIHRTQNQRELAEIYSVADVFVNPTREEVLGLVNIEALACGTPVVTFDSGGSPECIDDTCGIVIPRNDVRRMEQACRYICENRPFEVEACLRKASAFSKQERFRDYVDLIESISRKNTPLL